MQNIAKNGRERVISDHDVELRPDHILKTAEKRFLTNAKNLRLNTIDSVHYELEKSFHCISNDLDASQHKKMKIFFEKKAMLYSKNWKEIKCDCQTECSS